MKDKKRRGHVALPLPIRNKLRGTHQPFRAINESRPHLSIRSMPLLAKAMRDLARRGLAPFPALFPSSLKEIRPDGREFSAIDLPSEALWVASVLHVHSDRVNSFLSQKKKLEDLVIDGRFAEALAELDRYERQGGASLWLIDLRFALSQSHGGMTLQKRFLRELLASRPHGDPVAFLAHYASMRNEDTTQIYSFREQVEDRIRNIFNARVDREWLLFHIIDELRPATDLTAILRQEQASPLIDWHETFMKCAIYAVASELDTANAFLAPLALLGQTISDPRIQRILALAGESPETLASLPLEDPIHYDQRLVGHPCDAPALPPLPQASQCQVENLLPAHSDTAPEISAMVGAILKDLSQLTAPNLDIQSWLSLLRQSQNYICTRLPSYYYLAAWRQVSTKMLTERNYLRVEFIEAGELRLSHLTLFTGGQLSSIVERFIAQYPGSAALYLAIASINCRDSQALAFNPPSLDKIHPDRLSLASVIRNVRQEEWHNAISSSRTLLNSPIPSVGREAARILSGSLLEIGDVHDAAEFIVSAVLRDENLCYQLPISATIQAITKEYRHRFVGDLSTPIIFDLLRNRPGSVESNRTYAYEDFLFAHNLERPSQLADHLEGFDPVQLTYYLRHLCTTDTMQMSIAFAGTRECEDERIKVCTLLASIDSTNTKTYEAESRAIMQSQVIRMGVSQVEENKIYVDESALRKWATMNLRESYARYQALRSANKDGERSDVMDAIRSALQAVAPTTLVLAVPENESSDLLVVMLEKLVTEFLSSAQHGLDSYLSMRVRHGSLAGTLRYPLETNGVITQREGQSNQYTANEYWLYRLPDLSSTETRAVHRALQEFSRAYDDLIDDYSSNYVQVRGEAKPQGLFDLPITEGIILYLSNNFYPDTPLDAFLDYAFAYMREAVDRCLERVREHIDTHLGTRADAVVERLEGELATVGIDRVHELDAAVHVAHTELRRTIQDIKKWFYRGERTSEGEFRFEELVRIGLMCVTRIHEDFEPRLTISWTRDDLTFKDIGLFADLFVIIFDNIRIHSGVEAPQVSVTAKLEGRILLLTVRSAVAVGHVTEAKRERVRQIRDAILAGRSHRGTRTEGGTGLKKLRNILGWQIGPSDPLEFHFDEDENEFVVKCAVVVI